MLNTPRFNSTSIHQRLSRQLTGMNKTAGKPQLEILAGSSRSTADIVEANGFDVQVATKSPLGLRQRVVVLFQSDIPTLDVAIPGVVHWLNSRANPAEAGIALQETIPEKLTVRPTGCVRNGIRFSCKISGTLSWTQSVGDSKSGFSIVKVAATALNYSRDGFCLQLTTEPAIGSSVTFSWQNGRSESRIQGIVRWVIGQSGGAMAGCELIDGKGYMLGGVDV
jgi:hypothetical protein